MEIDISVVIPAYNEENYIVDTIKSIEKSADYFFEKTNQGVEIIVVNNASKDNTDDIALKAGAKVISLVKKSISKARNAGAADAKGKSLVFIDADNRITETLLYNAYKKLSLENVIGGGTNLLPNTKSIIIKFLYSLYNKYLKFKGIYPGAIFVKKNIFNEIKRFDENLFALEDVDFLIKLKKYAAKNNKDVVKLKEDNVITSIRKFENFGIIKTLLLFILLILFPFLLKFKKFCFVWYEYR